EDGNSTQQIFHGPTGSAGKFPRQEQVLRTDDDRMAREIEQSRNRLAGVALFDAQHADLWIDEVVPLLPVSCGTLELSRAKAGAGGNSVLKRLNRRLRKLFDEKFLDRNLRFLETARFVKRRGRMVVRARDQHMCGGNASGFFNF